MTESIEALVAEACEFLSGENAQYYDAALVKALTDALEAEHKRAEELRAVIERVKAYLRANGLPVEASEFAGMDEWERGFTLAGDCVLGILRAALDKEGNDDEV